MFIWNYPAQQNLEVLSVSVLVSCPRTGHACDQVRLGIKPLTFLFCESDFLMVFITGSLEAARIAYYSPSMSFRLWINLLSHLGWPLTLKGNKVKDLERDKQSYDCVGFYSAVLRSLCRSFLFTATSCSPSCLQLPWRLTFSIMLSFLCSLCISEWTHGLSDGCRRSVLNRDEGSFWNPLQRAVQPGSWGCRLSVSSGSSRKSCLLQLFWFKIISSWLKNVTITTELN